MGCGKSSVGRELSRLLCCPFIDLDSFIEEREGRPIPEIFASEGEASFRRMELEALHDIVAQPVDSVGPRLRSAQAPPSRGWQNANSVNQADAPILSNKDCDAVVLALGGGTVMTKECAEMVQEKTRCIYLRASADTLAERLADEADGRPLLVGNLMDRINELMAMRSSTYEQTAHIIIDSDGKSIEEIAREICRNLEKMC